MSSNNRTPNASNIIENTSNDIQLASNTNEPSSDIVGTNHEPQNSNHSLSGTRSNSNSQLTKENVSVVDQDDRVVISATTLESLITNIVSRVLSNHCEQPSSSNYVNLGAQATQLQNSQSNFAQLSHFEKVPDVVKSVKEFSGDAKEFNSWKNSVDRVLGLYETLIGTAEYHRILIVIRNKITKDADAVLESHHVPLEWGEISRCLTIHFADRRDLSSLEFQMASLRQGNKTIQEFYQTIQSHLSLILSKVMEAESSEEISSILRKSYKDRALDAFIRGLNGDLPRLLVLKEPSDLPHALQLCIKLQNQTRQSLTERKEGNDQLNYSRGYPSASQQGHFRNPFRRVQNVSREGPNFSSTQSRSHNAVSFNQFNRGGHNGRYNNPHNNYRNTQVTNQHSQVNAVTVGAEEYITSEIAIANNNGLSHPSSTSLSQQSDENTSNQIEYTDLHFLG